LIKGVRGIFLIIVFITQLSNLPLPFSSREKGLGDEG
jgi:hypothetical protein